MDPTEDHFTASAINSIESLQAAPASPSSISDALYLIAAHHSDVFDVALQQKLNQANISSLRGELQVALSLVEEILDELKNQASAADSVRGLWLYLLSLVDGGSDRLTQAIADATHGESGVFDVVSQCIQSNELWYQGNLLEGLWLNQLAADSARGAAPIWQIYPALLLAKKLTDIHVSGQVLRVVSDMEKIIVRSGLHVYEPIPTALRSALQLQSNELDKAIGSAKATLYIAEQRSTTVGVKLALSIMATAYVRLGDLTSAARSIKMFHTRTTHHVFPDSVARITFAEVMYKANRGGTRSAAEFARSKWDLLGTEGGNFIEDIKRPAQLIGIALEAGDSELAQRVLQAIEKLAKNNPGMPIVNSAVDSARAAMASGGFSQPQHPVEAGNRIEFHNYRSAAAPLIDPTRLAPSMPIAPAMPIVPGPPPIPPRMNGTPRGTGDAAAPESPGPATTQSGTLSRRETEIALLVGQGMTNQQVANRLDISPHTVNFHLRKIFRKLSITTRVQLAGIIDKSPSRDIGSTAATRE